MSKSQKQQSDPPAGANGDGDQGDTLAGSTLEDYFATHKVSGHVSQYLLNVSTDNDVMAAERVDGDGDGDGLGRVLAAGMGCLSERKSERDGYEDDYESETPAVKAEPPSDLAGMTLSDYLHVKEEDATAQEKASRAGSLRTLPPQLAPAAKKVAPTLDVSGMSLDHYLGASGEDTQADKKPSPKVKRKNNRAKHTVPALPQAKPVQQPFSVKGSGLVHGPLLNASSQNVSSDEESGSAGSSLTPFQRHQKRKDRVRNKQQRHAGSGPSVSKAILMAEAASSPTAILSVRDREKRKASLTVMNPSAYQHHPSHYSSHALVANSQPPLPKLAMSSSVRSLSQKDHDANVSSSDDDAAEKLPPL